MKINLYIQEVSIEAIINSSSISIQLNNDTNDPSATSTISTNTLELTVGGSKIVNQFIADGVTGGVGIFEGLPARLELESGSEIINLIDGYIDLKDSSNEFECDKVSVKIVQKGGNDWFQKRKDSFSYGFLASLEDGRKGKISPTDYVPVPYIISTIPNVRELALISLSVFVLGMQIRTVIKDITGIIVGFVGAASAIRAIIRLLLYVAFLIILVIAMIKLLQQLVNLIIQPVKYHMGMRLKTLLEKGAEHMGQKFESTNFLDPFWSDLVILPDKFQSFDDGTNSGILGFLKPDFAKQKGYFNGTFGQVLNIAIKLWNARVIVGDGVIRLERVDKNLSPSSYVIPAVEILAKQYNTDEFKSNTSIRFSTDLSDANTIDQLDGTFTDIIVEPLAIENDDMVLMDGLELIEIGVAQAKRKNKLTAPEFHLDLAVKAIGPLLDAMLKIAPPDVKKRVPLGGISNLIENRKGMMLLANDYFTTPKVVSLNIGTNPVDTKIKDENATRLTSDALYAEAYYVNSFVPSAKLPAPNQWVKRKHDAITFCFDDYKLVRNNNLIFDSEDRAGKIISFDWQIEAETLEAEYWEQQIYTTNLKETILTPDGL